MTPSVVFFGSFLHFSATILDAMIEADRRGDINLLGAVTTAPQPAGRKQELKKTEVQILAETKKLPIFTPTVLTDATLTETEQFFGATPDLIVTAGYGKLLPSSWLNWPTLAALNLHFSLLPKYRGANPAEWAILMGETETGITLIEMSSAFDTGSLVAQITIPIEAQATRETIYHTLYSLGAETLPSLVKAYASSAMTAATVKDNQISQAQQIEESLIINGKVYRVVFFYPPQVQPVSPTPYAKRFQKADGFIDWVAISQAMKGEVAATSLVSPVVQSLLSTSQQQLGPAFIERATRALAGFPGVWTKVQTTKGEKRLKILATSLDQSAGQPRLTLEMVQIEGQSPATWNQIKNTVQSPKNQSSG